MSFSIAPSSISIKNHNEDLSTEISYYVELIENNLKNLYRNLNQKNEVDKTEADNKFIDLYQYYDKNPSNFYEDKEEVIRSSSLFKVINSSIIKRNSEYILEIYTDRLKQMKEQPVTSSEAAIIDTDQLYEINKQLNKIIDSNKFYFYVMYNQKNDNVEEFKEIKKYIFKRD